MEDWNNSYIMEDWKEYNMGELVSLRQGFAVNKKSNHHISESRTNFPLLKISDLLNGTETLFVKSSIPAQFLVEPHEIIYSRTGQVGYAFIARKGVVYNNCFRVTPNDKIDSIFLFHLLNSAPVRELARVLATGSAQPDLNHGAFKSIKVTIPPKPIQRKIASILSAYDDLIENNLRRIKLLEEKAQLTYEEWFVRMKFPGHESVEIDKETGLPEGWYTKKLNKLSGVNLENIDKAYDGDIQYIDIKGVSPNSIDSLTEYSIGDAPGRAKRIVRHGDIIWSCVRPNRKSHAIVWKPESNWIASTGFCVISPKKLPTSYLYHFLTTESFVGYLTNLAGGAAYPAVKANHFKSANILVPTEELVRKYDDKFQKSLELIWNLKRQNQLLKEARDILLPRLMTGMIDVEKLDLEDIKEQPLGMMAEEKPNYETNKS